MQIATDSTAGERERGSLEPLLSTRPRAALAAGKCLAAALMAMCRGAHDRAVREHPALPPAAGHGHQVPHRPPRGPRHPGGGAADVLSPRRRRLARHAGAFLQGGAELHGRAHAAARCCRGWCSARSIADRRASCGCIGVPVLGQQLLLGEVMRGEVARAGAVRSLSGGAPGDGAVAAALPAALTTRAAAARSASSSGVRCECEGVVRLRQPLGNASRASGGRGSRGDACRCRSGDRGAGPPSGAPSCDRRPVRPLAEQGLDESLGLAVGLRPIGRVTAAGHSTGGTRPRASAPDRPTVVGEEAPDRTPRRRNQARVAAGTPPGRRIVGRQALRHTSAESHHRWPRADTPSRRPGPPPPIAVDAMAHAHHAAEPFEIDVEQVADVRPLVALHRRGRLEPWPADSGRRGATPASPWTAASRAPG